MVPGLHILSSYLVELERFIFLALIWLITFWSQGNSVESLWKDFSQLTVCFISSICFEFAIFQLPLILSGSCIRKHNEHEVFIYDPYTLVISQTFLTAFFSHLFSDWKSPNYFITSDADLCHSDTPSLNIFFSPAIRFGGEWTRTAHSIQSVGAPHLCNVGWRSLASSPFIF